VVPISRISELPHEAQWSRVTDVSLKGSTRNIEVYDLTWGEKAYDGSIVFKKWRVFLDPTTKLPQRTEFYEKSSADSEYNLRSVKVVESLSDSEIQEVIEEASS
jgi:outer membrane lipoprotein-sorting protein